MLRDESGGGVGGRRLHAELFGNSEVEDFHAIAVDNDVVGLDVAMNDPFLVCFGERVGDATTDATDIRLGERMAANHFRERLTGDVLHRDEDSPFRFFERMNRGDVGVVELRGSARFAAHARDRFGVGGDRLRKNLDGHDAAKSNIFRFPHFPHSARADLLDQLVRAELLVRCGHATEL